MKNYIENTMEAMIEEVLAEMEAKGENSPRSATARRRKANPSAPWAKNFLKKLSKKVLTN